MQRIIWKDIAKQQRKKYLKRLSQPLNKNIFSDVQLIVDEVKNKGDDAVIAYTSKFDGVLISDLKVSQQEFIEAEKSLPEKNKRAIKIAFENIKKFHSKVSSQTKVETMPGVICEKVYKPIESVGLYVPGGTAPLPSTVLMLAIPAKIAGCKNIILCTPPRKDGSIDPHILFAAKLCEVDVVYKIGGAQSIAAMAYGTSQVTKVDKIFGPGNKWVTAAKMLVANDSDGAAIDMPAGPSEVMVIADEYANSKFIAADLLAQAEHDIDAEVTLVTHSETLCSEVEVEIKKLTQTLSRKNIIEQSLQKSRCFIVENINDAIEIANCYAPEHLIIQTQQPAEIANQISTSGSVFVGAFAPESVGDYASGTNHVLPTQGYARSYSGISVQSFLRHMTLQTLTREGLNNLADTVMTLAEIEGLDAHRLAVAVRIEP